MRDLPVRARRSGILLLVAAALPFGCSHPGADALEHWKTDEGQSVGHLVSGERLVVVLVVDPGNLRECSTTIAMWDRWESENPQGEVVLVFTRTPQQWEAEHLRLTGRRDFHVLQSPRWRRPATGQLQAAFIRGKRVASSEQLTDPEASRIITLLRDPRRSDPSPPRANSTGGAS